MTYLLKKLTERYLRTALIYHRKIGFAIPVAEWSRARLALLTEEVLFEARLIEPLNVAIIKQTVKEFLEQQIDHSSRLWALSKYVLWRRYCVVLS